MGLPDPGCFQACPGFPSNSCLCAPIRYGSTLPLLRRRFRQGTRRTPKRLFGCLTVCTSVTSARGLRCTGRLNLRVCVHIAHRHIPSPTHGNCTLQPPRPIAPSRPRPAPAPAVPFITQPYRYLVRLDKPWSSLSASLPCLPAATGPQFVAGCSLPRPCRDPHLGRCLQTEPQPPRPVTSDWETRRTLPYTSLAPRLRVSESPAQT